MFTVCLVLAAGLLVALVLLYVLVGSYDELLGDFRAERAAHDRTRSLVTAVEVELDAPIPFTMAGGQEQPW